MSDFYEYCPNCDANLTLQKGYDATLPYWVCLGCGQMLINPELDTDSDIIWRCDNCGDLLNLQEGFNEDIGYWTCKKCGCDNAIDEANLYESEDERILDCVNPYKGLSDEDVLELSQYKDIEFVENRENVILIEDVASGKTFVKKLLDTYDKSVYEYLLDNPIQGMPKIMALYESNNCLIVIEEYIEGKTIAELLDCDVIEENDAIDIVRKLCVILNELHTLPRPIIHRDIKPSNVMICSNDEVFLLDVNVAKWYKPDTNDDTRYLGTDYYAPPEQVGYGFSSSSTKSDIYALGVLMNVMITGAFPKEKKADGRLWSVIEKCMSLEADKRYSAMELLDALKEI